MLPNTVRLEILGGGQLCASNILYRIPSPLGLCRTKTFRWIVFVRGKVAEGRMRGHKGTVASLQSLYVIPQRACVHKAGIVTLRDLKLKGTRALRH